jgi:hypothetical protein
MPADERDSVPAGQRAALDRFVDAPGAAEGAR